MLNTAHQCIILCHTTQYTILLCFKHLIYFASNFSDFYILITFYFCDNSDIQTPSEKYPNIFDILITCHTDNMTFRNCVASHRRPYCSCFNSQAPMGNLIQQWDVINPLASKFYKSELSFITFTASLPIFVCANLYLYNVFDNEVLYIDHKKKKNT